MAFPLLVQLVDAPDPDDVQIPGWLSTADDWPHDTDDFRRITLYRFLPRKLPEGRCGQQEGQQHDKTSSPQRTEGRHLLSFQLQTYADVQDVNARVLEHVVDDEPFIPTSSSSSRRPRTPAH